MPKQARKKLAVALVCADWRLHHKRVDLNARLARLLGVDGIDIVAVPGPDGLLQPKRKAEWKVAVDQIALLASLHHAKALAVVAHEHCMGHPVGNEEHVRDAKAVAKALKKAAKFSGAIEAVVATYQSDAKWGLERIGKQ
jgi:hypothetical protein